MKTMAYRSHAGMALLYHTAVDPPAGEWGQLVAFATEHVLACERYLSLIMTEGGSPNGQQRDQLAHAVRDTDPKKVDQMKAAVLTESIVARGVLTAFSWLGFGIKGFRQKDLPGALSYLGVDPALANEIAEVFDQLKGEIAQHNRPGSHYLRSSG